MWKELGNPLSLLSKCFYTEALRKCSSRVAWPLLGGDRRGHVTEGNADRCTVKNEFDGES